MTTSSSESSMTVVFLEGRPRALGVWFELVSGSGCEEILHSIRRLHVGNSSPPSSLRAPCWAGCFAQACHQRSCECLAAWRGIFPRCDNSESGRYIVDSQWRLPGIGECLELGVDAFNVTESRSRLRLDFEKLK